MDRFTISLDVNLASAFDELIKERGYVTRSRRSGIFCAIICSVARKNAIRAAHVSRICRMSTTIMNVNSPSV